jgi:hypothetical protein
MSGIIVISRCARNDIKCRRTFPSLQLDVILPVYSYAEVYLLVSADMVGAGIIDLCQSESDSIGRKGSC